MIVGIHQAHYLPWAGYIDKMLKSDKFVILDEVQLETPSPMVRNKVLDISGHEIYLTVDIFRKGFLEKKANEIEVCNQTKWQKKSKNFLLLNYKKAPFFDEIFPLIQPIYEKNYKWLFDVEIDTVEIMRSCFDIDTEIVLQSDLHLDETLKNNDLLIAILKKIGADRYLSGNGARKYMDLRKFNEQGIAVGFQKFVCPVYAQFNTNEFVPNLSALDMLFNLGKTESTKLIKSNIKREDYV